MPRRHPLPSDVIRRRVLSTGDGLPVKKLRPRQAAQVYNVSIDYLRDLDPVVSGRTRLSTKLTVYDVACLQRHFRPDTLPGD